ncbi:hypothetical protein ACFY2R_14590 [Micromonospora olivasterospora]|uniref:Uncharacterized protein n=1 Tax=Micromonospora olivasterospora TaxID=1880 RepID=A0A562IB75_MICOL|nr:hypothetical protein [Micromonospora olivasterospora]TWH68152.1 hypothetical protein JD77_03140 [Micromonospora olivasterospora]
MVAEAGHHGSGGEATAVDPAATDRVLTVARTAGLTGPVEITPPEDTRSAWTVTQVDNTWPVRFAIGWALPLFGLMLLAFLAIDLAVAAWTSRRGGQRLPDVPVAADLALRALLLRRALPTRSGSVAGLAKP